MFFKNASSYLASFLYSLALAYLYEYFAYPKYSYLGWQFSPHSNLLYQIIIAALSALFVFFVPKYVGKPSHIFCLFTYLLVYLPVVNITYISLENSNSIYTEIFTNYTLSMSLIIFLVRSKINFISIKGISHKIYMKLWYSLIFLFFIVIFIFYRPDFSSLFRLNDISDVYGIRDQYRNINNNIPAIAQYIFAWSIKFCVPLILVLGLFYNKKKQVLLSFILMVSLFVVSGQKSIFLGYILTFGIWKLLYLNNFKIPKEKFISLTFFLTFIGVILHLFGVDVWTDIIIRRAMLVPGLLSGFYHEFFSINGFTYLGYSFLADFVSYNYSATPPFIIGEYYFNRPEMSANANFIAAAYADFGMLGSIIFSIVASIIYKFIDYISEKKDSLSLSTALVVMPTWALADSALPTVLITHGLGLLIIFLIMKPSMKEN